MKKAFRQPSVPSVQLPDAADSSREVWQAVRALLVITTILIAFGLTMLYSASYGIAGLKYFRNQLIWITLGTAGGVGVFLAGYKNVAAKSMWWMLISFILLMAACFFFKPVNGASRWIRLGSFSIQPSEFAKIAVAVFVAKYCADNARTFSLIRHRRGLLPLCAGAGIVILGILMGRDLGTTILVGTMTFFTMLAAGLFFRYLIIPVILGGVIAVYIKLFDPMRLARVVSFMNPEVVQKGKGYQLWNSLLALGSGNWFGVGFMTSRLKAKYLPEAHTDFILAIVGEELGFVAMAAVILLYTLYGYYALRIAFRSSSRLGMLLGFALTLGVTVQAAINLAVVSGSAPTKGMPAPFISYGGSNMIACLLATGLLVSIAFDTIDPGYEERLAAKLPWRRKK
jgi:cell division protein FtsW